VVTKAEEEPPPLIQPPIPVAERNLYTPFQAAITSGYVKDNRIKRFVSEITASQGRRSAGGRWPRPDLTLIAVRTYSFTPCKTLEVITFEVKPNLDTALEGVFEALAQSVVAHRSYLAVDISDFNADDQIPDDRIVQECGRLEVGYITFSDAAGYNTYDIVNTVKLKEPTLMRWITS
jgi:hypothetical protein